MSKNVIFVWGSLWSGVEQQMSPLWNYWDNRSRLASGFGEYWYWIYKSVHPLCYHNMKKQEWWNESQNLCLAGKPGPFCLVLWLCTPWTRFSLIVKQRKLAKCQEMFFSCISSSQEDIKCPYKTTCYQQVCNSVLLFCHFTSLLFHFPVIPAATGLPQNHFKSPPYVIPFDQIEFSWRESAPSHVYWEEVAYGAGCRAVSSTANWTNYRYLQ